MMSYAELTKRRLEQERQHSRIHLSPAQLTKKRLEEERRSQRELRIEAIHHDPEAIKEIHRIMWIQAHSKPPLQYAYEYEAQAKRLKKHLEELDNVRERILREYERAKRIHQRIVSNAEKVLNHPERYTRESYQRFKQQYEAYLQEWESIQAQYERILSQITREKGLTMSSILQLQDTAKDIRSRVHAYSQAMREYQKQLELIKKVEYAQSSLLTALEKQRERAYSEGVLPFTPVSTPRRVGAKPGTIGFQIQQFGRKILRKEEEIFENLFQPLRNIASKTERKTLKSGKGLGAVSSGVTSFLISSGVGALEASTLLFRPQAFISSITYPVSLLISSKERRKLAEYIQRHPITFSGELTGGLLGGYLFGKGLKYMGGKIFDWLEWRKWKGRSEYIAEPTGDVWFRVEKGYQQLYPEEFWRDFLRYGLKEEPFMEKVWRYERSKPRFAGAGATVYPPELIDFIVEPKKIDLFDPRLMEFIRLKQLEFTPRKSLLWWIPTSTSIFGLLSTLKPRGGEIGKPITKPKLTLITKPKVNFINLPLNINLPQISPKITSTPLPKPSMKPISINLQKLKLPQITTPQLTIPQLSETPFTPPPSPPPFIPRITQPKPISPLLGFPLGKGRKRKRGFTLFGWERRKYRVLTPAQILGLKKPRKKGRKRRKRKKA